MSIADANSTRFANAAATSSAVVYARTSGSISCTIVAMARKTAGDESMAAAGKGRRRRRACQSLRPKKEQWCQM